MSFKDDLKIFGFEHMPTLIELKVAYRQLALTAHPDRGGDAKEFTRIVAAYARLLDDAQKVYALCPVCEGRGRTYGASMTFAPFESICLTCGGSGKRVGVR